MTTIVAEASAEAGPRCCFGLKQCFSWLLQSCFKTAVRRRTPPLSAEAALLQEGGLTPPTEALKHDLYSIRGPHCFRGTFLGLIRGQSAADLGITVGGRREQDQDRQGRQGQRAALSQTPEAERPSRVGDATAR
jgi:hypothetical protein